MKIVEKRVEVLPLTPPFIPQIEEQKSFLKTARTVTFTNTGNVRNTQISTIDVGALSRLFTITDPDARTVRNAEGKRAICGVSNRIVQNIPRISSGGVYRMLKI